LYRTIALDRSEVDPERCLALIWGVHVNGRPYKQGDHVEYMRPNSDTSLLGTINMFYTFNKDVFLEITVNLHENVSLCLFNLDRTLDAPIPR
jgi:hypothetical protein